MIFHLNFIFTEKRNISQLLMNETYISMEYTENETPPGIRGGAPA